LRFLTKYTIIIITLIFLTSCTRSSNQTSYLKIGLMPTMDSVVVATAYELGFFDEFGVNVELVPFSSARERDAAFLAGLLDGATVDLIAVGLFNEADIFTRATSVTTAHFTLIANPNYKTLKELENKTVMISHNTAIDFVLDQMLSYYNLDSDYIVREEVGNIPTRFEMVRTLQADAALISEPFATMAKSEGLTQITDTLTIDFNPFVLAFSLEAIENRVDDIRNFYKAYQLAVEYLNNQADVIIKQKIIDIIGFPDTAADYIELPIFLEPALPSENITQVALDWLINRNLVASDTTIEMFFYDIFQ